MTGEVALWWVRYSEPDYEICGTEREAAERAWGIQDSGEASVLGIQYPDGRLTEADDWLLLEQVTAEFNADITRAAAEAATRPPKPKRLVRDPFGNRPFYTDPGEPEWLGGPP